MGWWVIPAGESLGLMRDSFRGDRYNKCHISGYHNGNDGNEQNFHSSQATLMEAWLDEMNSRYSAGDGVGPNIETYEAVIQAWLRTVTRKGLDRADAIASNLLSNESSVKPRLQTFHPIIASWLHAKDPDSPAKVEEWVNRLMNISSSTRPELQPDMRMITALLSSKVSKQLDLLQSSQEKPTSEKSINDDKSTQQQYDSSTDNGKMDLVSNCGKGVIDEIVKEAKACNDILAMECARFESAVASGDTSMVFIDCSIFAHCLEAWRNVASACLGAGAEELKLLDQSLGEMVSIVLKFEDIMETTAILEDPTGVDIRTQIYQSTQLMHFALSGQHVFVIFLDAILDLHTQASSTHADILGPILLNVEQMTRRVMEMNEIVSRSTTVVNDDESKLRYDDLFEYSSGEIGSGTKSKVGFIHRVIDFIRRTSPTVDRLGDMARLCFLLKEFVNTLKTSQSNENEKIDRLIARIVPSNRMRFKRCYFPTSPSNGRENTDSNRTLIKKRTSSSRRTVQKHRKSPSSKIQRSPSINKVKKIRSHS